jgi:ligand-binding SRPBCC domain-containing protein
MKYHHRYSIRAPSFFVFEFHTKSANLGLITPPWIPMRFHETPERLTEGDRLVFSLRLGPFPIYWEARIENITPEGFTDRMISGPFRSWIHRHSFLPLEDNRTGVEDEIEFTLHRHILWALVGIMFALSMPLLFAYRSRKTKRLLETDDVIAKKAQSKEMS